MNAWDSSYVCLMAELQYDSQKWLTYIDFAVAC